MKAFDHNHNAAQCHGCRGDLLVEWEEIIMRASVSFEPREITFLLVGQRSALTLEAIDNLGRYVGLLRQTLREDGSLEPARAVIPHEDRGPP